MEKTISLQNHSLQLMLPVLFGFSLLTLCSFCKLPCYPVSFTLHTLAINYIGLTQSPKQAFLSVLSYLLLIKGVSFLFALSAGYYIAMPFAAYLIAHLSKNKHPILATLSGQFLIYLLGASWLALSINPLTAIYKGAILFIPSDLLKNAVAIAMSKQGGTK